MSTPQLPAHLDEIRQLLKGLPGPDLSSRRAAKTRQAQLLKPPGALGRLEALAHWLATWQGRERPGVERPRIAVFAANHGVAAQGGSAYPPAVTAQMVQAFVQGQAAVNQMAELNGADLRVYELALDQPTDDFTQGPAMSEADCVRAIAYGMMAVEPGFDVMALGEMGIGNTTAAAALCHGLFGGEARDWVGRGTGVDDATLIHKGHVIEQAVAVNRDAMGDPLEVLRCLGGLELAAIVGAIVACRLAHTPVLLDGYACTAAAAVLHAVEPALLDHCVVAHVSAEPGHRRLLRQLGKEPLLDLGLRLGEASGAALALPLLAAAAACLNGMATFAEAGVSGKVG